MQTTPRSGSASVRFWDRLTWAWGRLLTCFAAGQVKLKHYPRSRRGSVVVPGSSLRPPAVRYLACPLCVLGVVLEPDRPRPEGSVRIEDKPRKPCKTRASGTGTGLATEVPAMDSDSVVLIVDRDAAYGHALAVVLRRQGQRVKVVRTRTQALLAAERGAYDIAIVDLFVGGGGAELARDLSRHVPRVFLSLGARLPPDELLEAVLGFPVHRKAVLPDLFKVPGASSNGRASGARRPGSPPLVLAANELFPAPPARVRGRARRLPRPGLH